MKLIVSGKTRDFTPELEDKFSSKISRLGKLIEQRGEREAHVTHQVERHLHKIEVVVNFHDHSLVGEGIDSDLDTALCNAVEKLEKQIIRQKTRWRDTHRDAKGTRSAKEDWDTNGTVEANGSGAKPANGKAAPVNAAKPKIFRVNYGEDRKPMTLAEAVMEIERDRDEYVIYRDADRDCLSVLVRRHDGNLDLIES